LTLLDEVDSMTDPTFGHIDFRIDAWDGILPFDFARAGTTALAVHVWSDESGPTDSQRKTFEQLRTRYEKLWPAIAEALRDCHPQLKATDDVEAHLNPIVGCCIENVARQAHHDFELVYDFDLDKENGRAIFVRISGWRIIEAVLAE
jgi:hypothetical protein